MTYFIIINIIYVYKVLNTLKASKNIIIVINNIKAILIIPNDYIYTKINQVSREYF